MLTRPFTRLVVAFGHRYVTQRRIVEEVVLGCLLVFPFGIWMGLIVIRLCAKGNFLHNYIRSDVWTTIVVFLAGDMLMEFLLPSLKCLPLDTQLNDHGSRYRYNLEWLSQTYGLTCPYEVNTPQSHHLLLTPDATALLFTLRLLFLCAGVYLGESFFPIALTGGIACGKSTVAQLLVDYNKQATAAPTVNTSGKGRRKLIKANNNNNNAQQEEKEGTVHLIDADAIAHEILLPPSVLMASDEEGAPEYIVHPHDSVYPKIVQAFGHLDIFQDDADSGHNKSNGQQYDDNNNNNNKDGDDSDEDEDDDASTSSWIQPLIDRRKLGAVIFQDVQKRRLLNATTHPRILWILVKRLVRGIFTSQKDLIIADIPLLFESGKLKWLFGLTICVVVSDPAVQLQRLQQRNPDLSKSECQSRINSQLSLEVKQTMADLVIENDGSQLDLSDQVEDVRRELMARIYGIGMSLLQMLLLIGGSTSIAVSSKFYTKWGD
jgi:dephospho-CoA kinase